MRVVREERAHGGGRLGRGTGGAHNHVDDGVDGLLHVEVPGRLQAGGGEVAAVGMVRGDDVEPLVLGVGGQSKTCGHSCRMCPGDMLGTGVHWPPWGPASALQHAVCPRAHPQGSCGEHPCCAVPTRWLGEMATENTLIPKCLASLAASSRPPQGSLYPSKGCPSVTTIRYLFSLRWEPLQRFKHRDQCRVAQIGLERPPPQIRSPCWGQLHRMHGDVPSHHPPRCHRPQPHRHTR